jgi:hypothetical protein
MIATLTLPPDCHMLPSCPCQTLDSICTGHFGRIWSLSGHVANRFSPFSGNRKRVAPRSQNDLSPQKSTNCKVPTTLRPHHHGGTAHTISFHCPGSARGRVETSRIPRPIHHAILFRPTSAPSPMFLPPQQFPDHSFLYFSKFLLSSFS